MMARFLALTATEGGLMKWNKEPVPFLVALQIGWNLPMDVVGAGVYGGIVKRDSNGKIIIGDEWPEDNRAPPAHNPVHSTGPYLDFSKLTQESRGYTKIATVIMAGKVAKLEALLESAGGEQERRTLANLVMSGGARPLHMCGMSRGGDSTELIRTLIKVRLHAACRPSLASPMPAPCPLACAHSHRPAAPPLHARPQYGADVNAKDNYEMTPMDRLASNSVTGNELLRGHGAVPGRRLPRGVPDWTADEFDYTGPGETGGEYF
jgi:hypothetical protein